MDVAIALFVLVVLAIFFTMVSVWQQPSPPPPKAEIVVVEPPASYGYRWWATPYRGIYNRRWYDYRYPRRYGGYPWRYGGYPWRRRVSFAPLPSKGQMPVIEDQPMAEPCCN